MLVTIRRYRKYLWRKGLTIEKIYGRAKLTNKYSPVPPSDISSLDRVTQGFQRVTLYKN